MNSHLVTVEVSIEALADQWMQVDRVTFYQRRLKRLDTHPVKRRSAIEQNRVILNYKLENVPDFLVFTFQHLLGALDRVSVTELFQLANDKWLKQFERNFFGQTTLMQFKLRPDDG